MQENDNVIRGGSRAGLSMSARAANLAALLVIAVSVLVVFRSSPRAGSIIFILLCYVVWFIARAGNIWFGLKRNRPWYLFDFLSASQKGIYKRFGLYIHRPALAFFFSTTLYWLRIGAVGWIAACLWQGLYLEAAILAPFLILSSGTISTMYPDLYFVDAAKRGNKGAAEMLHDLRHIQEMLTDNGDGPAA